MRKKLPTFFYVVPFAIMLAGFIIGQGKEGAGVPVVMLLSMMWVIYAVKHQDRKVSNG